MLKKVVIVTLDGKAHYIIINMLKEMEIPFEDIILGDKIDKNSIVITTKKEKSIIKHGRKLCIENLNKDFYLAKELIYKYLYENSDNSIVIGIDPGKVTGIAIYFREKLLHTTVFNTINEVIINVSNIIRKTTASKKIVKIGDGNPKLYQEIINELLKKIGNLATIEIVNESGTSLYLNKILNKRISKNQKSAMLIAQRQGKKY